MNTTKATALLLIVFSLSTAISELPHSTMLKYSDNYGAPAVMTFIRNGSSYKIVSSIEAPPYKIRFESVDTISDSILYPSHYRDTRGGKPYTEAKFNGHSVTYSRIKEGEETETVSDPTVDLFTLAWQFAAGDDKLPAGTHITNGKKLYHINSINKTDSSKYELGRGCIDIGRYRVRRGDSTVGYTFTTAFDNTPAQTSCTDDGRTYNLRLTGTTIDDKPVQPQQP